MSYLPPALPLVNSANPFPVDALPLIMQNTINYLQDGGKVPTVLVVNAVLAAVSLACHSHINVLNPYTDIEEHCSLNILTLADSGTGKSSVSKQVMKPFDAFRAELAESHRVNQAVWREDYVVWKTSLKALESKLRDAVKKDQCTDEAQAALKSHASVEPVRPVLPTLVYNDTSLAALIAGLNEYPCAGLISDEASNFFDARLKDNLAFFNKAWDGDMYEHNRHQRATQSFKPTLTVSLMLQPSLFFDYMKKDGDKALESGFLSRFLFSNITPNTMLSSCVMSHHYRPDTAYRDENALTCFHDLIGKLLGQQLKQIYSGEGKKKVLKLSPEAEVHWETMRENWLRYTFPGGAWSYIKPMVLKASTNVLRIAALLNYLTNQEDDIITTDVISRASAIVNWYLNHTAVWFYQFTDEYKFQQDVQILTQWIHHKFRSTNGFPFKKNDVIKYGPNKFRRSEKLEPLLNAIMTTGTFAYMVKSPENPAIYITWLMNDGRYMPFYDDKQPPSPQNPA
ncbi:YfjI family protein [Enterobacter sp. D2]|uniref:YfjI family protein n=1 Tax=Enterobacter sp. D2 TaxID=3102784 RepID=UPI002ACA57D9|nr:YfjI family protein [Enterobacter sp. D2]MDZ5729318.1 YfjI family protein [Enterobacter sp. D2]